MAKTKSRSFIISEAHHLFKVDKWWAGLLRQGTKEIVKVEWEALGMMRWKLRLSWRPISSDVKLNVGHPDYADYALEDLNHLMYEALDSFEQAYTDLTLLEKKVTLWAIEENPEKGELLSFREDLDDVDRLIAIEYVWPQYKNLRKLCSFLAIQMRETEAEIKARSESDYFSVKVDRGMLRTAYLEQVGYDNDFLFEEVEFLPPDPID